MEGPGEYIGGASEGTSDIVLSGSVLCLARPNALNKPAVTLFLTCGGVDVLSVDGVGEGL